MVEKKLNIVIKVGQKNFIFDNYSFYVHLESSAWIRL